MLKQQIWYMSNCVARDQSSAKKNLPTLLYVLVVANLTNFISHQNFLLYIT